MKPKPTLSGPKHKIAPALLEDEVSVALVGCGGSGSRMLTNLADLHLGMRALGHPGGLNVTAFDPDRVSRANLGRTPFFESDVGRNKAHVLVNRLNLAYGLGWHTVPALFECARLREGQRNGRFILISCVDTARSRRALHEYIMNPRQATPAYWLDMGNGQYDGHVILGQPAPFPLDTKGRPNKPLPNRPPIVTEVYPELLDEAFEEDDLPSCSLAEALERQSLTINRHMADLAATLLELLFRQGGLDFHGWHIDLQEGTFNKRRIPDAFPLSAAGTFKEAA